MVNVMVCRPPNKRTMARLIFEKKTIIGKKDPVILTRAKFFSI